MTRRWTVLAAAGLLALTACSGSGDQPAETHAAATPAASSTATTGNTEPKVIRTVATGLDVPWGIAFLPDGSAFVGQRPTGQVLRIGAGSSSAGTTLVGTVPGVADQGEGGLLGLAYQPDEDTGDGTLFAYLTSNQGDNRVVSIPYQGGRLGTPTPLLTGIASAGNHNGGLLTIGPDGKLWIGTGDATNSARSQDRKSLNGKILRIEQNGKIPADNPFPGSPVYSLGHRNVQGLAFDAQGRPWADEFGQNTWDELNLIKPGANYGWPTVEGRKAHAGFTEPVVQWHTDDASPSGMAIVNGTAYIAALKGERLWAVPLTGTTAGTPKALFTNEYGRLRNAVKTPDGTLWVATSNRDGRGNPMAGDDRILEIKP